MRQDRRFVPKKSEGKSGKRRERERETKTRMAALVFTDVTEVKVLYTVVVQTHRKIKQCLCSAKRGFIAVMMRRYYLYVLSVHRSWALKLHDDLHALSRVSCGRDSCSQRPSFLSASLPPVQGNPGSVPWNGRKTCRLCRVVVPLFFS